MICELPFIPNEIPFEFANSIVPDVAVCVPAAIPAGAVDWVALKLAVMMFELDPKLIPNEMLFEFENTTVPVFASPVPAEMFTPRRWDGKP